MYPETFEVTVEHFGSPSFKLIWGHDRLVLFTSEVGLPDLDLEPDELQPRPDEWERFWLAAEKIGVWSWKQEYYIAALDGTNWQLKIKHGEKFLSAQGSNAYPGSSDASPSAVFRSLIRSVGELVGVADLE